MDEMKTSIQAHIKSSLYDCLKVQIPETEKKLNQLKIRQSGGGNTTKIQADIIAMKQKFKEEKQLYSQLDRENFNRELFLWVKENHSESAKEFTRSYNEKHPRLTTD
jgi:hypothetical protein